MTLSFDRVAQDYEATRPLPQVIAERLARRCLRGLSADAWFLDAGAGTGRVGRSLARAHPRTLGADVSAQMLAHAVGVRGVLADLRALPLADGSIGGVLCLHVLHLIVEWEAALSELWRTLAPGGRLTLCFEEQEPTRTREFYLRAAREAGYSLTPPGGSATEIGQALPELPGASVSEAEPGELQFSTTTSVAQTLSGLRARTFSAMWNLPEESHQAFLEEAQRKALEAFGSERYVEVTRIRLRLLEATKGH